jgi:hypothetical protein
MTLVFLFGLAVGFSLALLCVGLVIEARAESRAALERSWKRGQR